MPQGGAQPLGAEGFMPDFRRSGALPIDARLMGQDSRMAEIQVICNKQIYSWRCWTTHAHMLTHFNRRTQACDKRTKFEAAVLDLLLLLWNQLHGHGSTFKILRKFENLIRQSSLGRPYPFFGRHRLETNVSVA
jgi:hypothetical protein